MKFIFILLFSFSIIYAQEADFKFKNPGKADFDYQQCPFEPEANAVILNEEGKLKVYPEVAQIEIKRRIKILNDKGRGEAVIKIRLYSGNHKMETINRLTAVTINGTSQNPEVISVSPEDIHEVDLNEVYKEIRFTFPNVKAGSILDYSYILETKNLLFIDSWEFQHHLPVERSYFMLNNESHHNFHVLVQGEKVNKLYGSEKEFKSIELTDINSSQDMNHIYNVKDNINKISFQNKFSAQTWKGLVRDKLNKLKSHKRSATIRKIADGIPTQANEKETFKAIAAFIKNNYAWDGFHGQ